MKKIGDRCWGNWIQWPFGMQPIEVIIIGLKNIMCDGVTGGKICGIFKIYFVCLMAVINIRKSHRILADFIRFLMKDILENICKICI